MFIMLVGIKKLYFLWPVTVAHRNKVLSLDFSHFLFVLELYILNHFWQRLIVAMLEISPIIRTASFTNKANFTVLTADLIFFSKKHHF